MNIRVGKKEDLNDIMIIINEAKAYFKNANIDQWQDGYPNEESILEDIKKGYCFVLELDGKLVGTSAIIFEDDPTYEVIEEGQWKQNDSYGVIHRVAVLPGYKGRGLANAFFAFAKEECKRRKVHALRADTHDNNTSMQHVMAKNGLLYCGIVYMEDGTKRNAYECVLD